MLFKETLKIVRGLLKKCNITNIEIDEAKVIVHSDPDKQEDWQDEYDIFVPQRVNHWKIQQIDKLLANYDAVEMEVTSEGLRIFEKEA